MAHKALTFEKVFGVTERQIRDAKRKEARRLQKESEKPKNGKWENYDG